MILELSDVHGRVIERRRLDEGTLRIGRGLENDVVLEDAYVCADHACIQAMDDGTFRIQDLGSRNGIWDEGLRHRIASEPLRPGQVLWIGHTRLCLRDPAAGVPPALPDPRIAGGTLQALRRIPVAVAAVLLMACILAAQSYLQIHGEIRMAAIIGKVAIAVVMIGAWSLVWMFASRIVDHRWRFLPHCAVASLFVSALIFEDHILAYIRFLWPVPYFWWSLDVVLSAVLVGFLLAGHLLLVSRAAARRRVLAAFSLAVLTTGGMTLLSMVGEEHLSSGLEFDSTLLPAPVALMRTSSLPDFLDDAAELKKEIEEAREDDDS